MSCPLECFAGQRLSSITNLPSGLIAYKTNVLMTGKIVIMPGRCIFKYMVTDTEHIFQQINELDAMIEVINQRILELTEKVKERYRVSSSTMAVNQNYLLSGIQRSPSPKNYIITSRGIEVVGEQEITPVSVFLDGVIQFANEPNRKIVVLKELIKHLQKMNDMAPNNP